MNQLSTFTYLSSTIRVMIIDGKPWFFATDVCRILGHEIERRGTSHALRPLREDEKRIAKTPISGRGNPNQTVISESGLYRLTGRSNKPEALAFQDWVYRDVLPAVRKDGAYIKGEERVATGELNEEEFILKAMSILQGKVERLRLENEQMSTELNRLTVDEWRALNHFYFRRPKEDATVLGRAVSMHCKAQGIQVEKQVRFIVDKRTGEDREVFIGVYPRSEIEAVARRLEDAGKITFRRAV